MRQAPGIYAAARVTRAPARDAKGTWLLRYQTDAALTRRLIRAPIVGRDLARLVPRSFGASIQVVQSSGQRVLAKLLGEESATADGPITHGLLILKEHLDKILAGTKTWEIRGRATARRGSIALIESKSGHLVGTCDIVEVVGPLSLAELQRNATRIGLRASQAPYATTYAWVVRNARRLPERIRTVTPRAR